MPISCVGLIQKHWILCAPVPSIWKIVKPRVRVHGGAWPFTFRQPLITSTLGIWSCIINSTQNAYNRVHVNCSQFQRLSSSHKVCSRFTNLHILFIVFYSNLYTNVMKKLIRVNATYFPYFILTEQIKKISIS